MSKLQKEMYPSLNVPLPDIAVRMGHSSLIYYYRGQGGVGGGRGELVLSDISYCLSQGRYPFRICIV